MDSELDTILSGIKREESLTEEMIKKLVDKYGTKFLKAQEAIETMSVKKYTFMPSGRVVWIVVGKEKEYFVIPNIYCQCDEFYINVVKRRKSELCYHILAQTIAERIGKYESYEVADSDFIRLNSEWKKEIL